jgi:hypothetical protein
VAAGQQHQLLRLARMLVGLQCQVGRGQVVAGGDHGQQRGGADALQVGAWLVLHQDLDGAQGDLVPDREGPLSRSSCSSVQHLVSRVRARLGEIAAEDLAPWVKLDRVVSRADRVTDHGSRIRVEATVRDPMVAEALLGLRPDQWRRRGPVAFTDHTTSRQMLVESVSTTMTVRSSQGFVLELAAETQPTTPTAMRMAVNGLEADELVERGLRHRLLGEPLPAQLHQMGFLAPSVSLDPIHHLPPEVAGSVAQLLLVEGLVGQGHATRVAVRLGPGRRGPRRVRVAWQPPTWGHPTAPRVIEGNLADGRPNPA